jgi:crotonobetainyl-CoA:carnitine CoA-transferase CaiB-like acyl-CoA transferase
MTIATASIASTTGVSPAALGGVRILDLTRMLAGPFCTALLADVGADVIKIENCDEGDDARAFEPKRGGESAYFMLLNRGKRSLALNLKDPEGQALLHGLVAKSDVLVENFRPGTAARLGLDYETLAAINPRLVYASISGFGQSGPLSHLPAYDIIAQAMSGLMSITGFPDKPPTRVGESLGDIVAGLYAALGILTALQARERTGRGQQVDVAMLDSMFSLLVTALCQYLYTGQEPRRIGNRHPISTPFDAFRARDGLVIIAVANQRLFARLVETIGRPELASDPRFVTDDRRTANESALRALIEEWTASRDVTDVVDALREVGVPVSPIWSVAEVANSEHVASRGLIARTVHATAGEIPLVRQPVQFSDTPSTIRRPPPLLGEHTGEILKELLHLKPDDVGALHLRGVIGTLPVPVSVKE